jgi:hypothetical protein
VPSIIASILVAPPFASNHIYTRTLSSFARTGQFNDGSAPSYPYLHALLHDFQQATTYLLFTKYLLMHPLEAHIVTSSLFSVNQGNILKHRVGSRRRPVARTVAAGTAARATHHYRPSPNRRPTGERGETSYSSYIFKFILWRFSRNNVGCGGEAWGWVTKVSQDFGP